MPVQDAARACGVDRTAQLFAGLGRSVAGRQDRARYVSRQLVEPVDAGLDASPDVIRAGWWITLQGEGVGAGDITDVDVIAGLLSLAVYGRAPTGGQIRGEDRHNPALTVRVLPGTVDVRVAQCYIRQDVVNAVEVEVTLP